MQNEDIFLFVAIFIGIIFFFIIYPYTQTNCENFDESTPIFIENKSDNKSDNINVIDKSFPRIDQNICSKQCCKHIQWPVPFNTKNPLVDKEILDNFIGSNLSCNNGENGGCVCLTKNDFNYLSNHGQS
jgi:hypothetical protein